MSEYCKRIKDIECTLVNTLILCLWHAILFQRLLLPVEDWYGSLRLCRGLGQAWRLLTAKSIEQSKLKIKNGSSQNLSSKGKIRKDLCLSHNENHGL